MGKVTSLINTTPDGFVDAQYGIVDAEFYEFTQSLLPAIQTIAFGRNTFNLFQDRWSPIFEKSDATEAKIKMGKVLADKHKIVYSSTLKTTIWSNSTIVQKIDAEQINVYKREGNGGILTLGSISIVEALARMNLIDDYYFCVQPIIAGKGGMRLFDKMNLDASPPLKYIDSTQLKSGVHIIQYQVA